MWTQLAGPILELLKWLLSALVGQATSPRGASVIESTLADKTLIQQGQDQFKRFPGVKIGLFLLICFCLSGCFEPRLILARPAIPVRLVDQLDDVRYMVKQPDGTYLICRGSLFPGMLVVPDPEFSAEDAAKAQHIEKVEGKTSGIISVPAGPFIMTPNITLESK